MKDSESWNVFGCIVVLFLMFLMGITVAHKVGASNVRKEAVSNNGAHYVLDENNERQFKWGPKP